VFIIDISAYENSTEAAAFDSSLKKANFGTIQNHENVKQILPVSTFLIQKPFEFPRQQNEKVSEPEVSQFRGSQRLFNPNESKKGGQKGRRNKHGKSKRFDNSQNGVILENNLNDPNSQIVFTILDFTKNQSFYALRYSYKPSEDIEMPLQIFDNINYEGDIKNLIHLQITRNKSYKKDKFECKNLGNGIFVVKAICVFSTGSPIKCFTNICGEIEFSDEVLSKVLLADVTLDCWLQFSFVKSSDVNLNNPSINHITYKFHSVEKVNTDFDVAYDAPLWKKSKPRKMYEIYDPFFRNYPSKVLQYLNRSTIYIPGKPRIPVSLALKEFSNGAKVELKPHMPIIVNICYCEILKRFIVYEMRTTRNGMELQATFTPDNFHQVNLSPVVSCPGFFIFGKNGLIHDKYGKLSEFHNLRLGITSVFHYVDPDEWSYTSLEIPQSKKINLDELQNIVFDAMDEIFHNEFYSPHLHYCLIYALEKNETYKVGHWYKLTIDSLNDETYVAIVNAKLVEDYGHIPSKKNGSNYEFLVEVSVQCCNIFKLLAAPYLGAIGMKEADSEKCFNGKEFHACSILFPVAKEVPEHRPQIRPIFIQCFKDINDGMTSGCFK
uniref:Uncharacterized protein n=1 Tax=Panagrolaimus sp. PS1159 TaxID=55785 RepID=A0AC35EZ96_9BILA